MKNKTQKILFLALLVITFFPLFTVHAQGVSRLCKMVGTVESIIWYVGGSIIVIGWIIAGILYLTSAGSPEKTGIAKKALIAAIIGTILVALSASAPAIIIDTLGEGSSSECTLHSQRPK